MSNPLGIELSDRRAVANALTQGYLFVVTVNAECALAAFSLTRPILLHTLVATVRNSFAQSEREWSSASEVVTHFKSLHELPSPQQRIIDYVAAVMAKPISSRTPTPESPTWNITHPYGAKTLLRHPTSQEVHFRVCDTALGPGFVVGGSKEDAVQRATFTTWDAPYDPIAILEGFCVDALGIRGSMVDHYVQQWIHESFGLSYRRDQALLQTVCRRVNSFFFGREYPSHDDFSTSRARTVDYSTLIAMLAEIFAESSDALDRVARRKALGVYALLRFNRSLRVFYGYLKRAGQAEVMQSRLGSEVRPRLCISGARPLEFAYLQVRAFGGLTGIHGLNYAFRGGILPRISRGHSMLVRGPAGVGKTAFVTHLLADIAMRGRCAAYFSLEESNESVLDRLETFWLSDPDLYEIIEFPNGIEKIAEVHQKGKGALLIVRPSRGSELEIGSLLRDLGDILEPLPRYRWRAIAIDSIDALRFQFQEQREEAVPVKSRAELRQLFDAIEATRFFGVIVGEHDGSCRRYASYLADTDVELGRDMEGARWLHVSKSRLQPAHGQRHTLQIREGRGIRVYPALGAVQSAARRRVTTTLSRIRRIPIPPFWKDKLGLGAIREKSSTLIYGPSGTGKTELSLFLATAASESERGARDDVYSPRGIYFVTFRTPELVLRQMIEEDQRLAAPWRSVPAAYVRWYSPGELFDGAQLVDDLRDRLRRGRREGMRIERIVFDEIEAIEHSLPRLASDKLLWPTITHLLSTEAVTTTFVVGSIAEGSHPLSTLQISCDYSFALHKSYVVEKQPHLGHIDPAGRD